jgi:hypothetical protein
VENYRRLDIDEDRFVWTRYCGGGGGEYDHTDIKLTRPDFRVGVLWTVKKWDKFWKKNTQTKKYCY